MNLIADESVDKQIVDLLRQDGHDVLFVAECSPGTIDEEVLARSRAAGAVLITADKDFGDLVYRERFLHVGVVPIRLPGIAPLEKAAIVSSAVRAHAGELSGAFVVITGRTVRIRRGPGLP